MSSPQGAFVRAEDVRGVHNSKTGGKKCFTVGQSGLTSHGLLLIWRDQEGRASWKRGHLNFAVRMHFKRRKGAEHRIGGSKQKGNSEELVQPEYGWDSEGNGRPEAGQPGTF